MTFPEVQGASTKLTAKRVVIITVVMLVLLVSGFSYPSISSYFTQQNCYSHASGSNVLLVIEDSGYLYSSNSSLVFNLTNQIHCAQQVGPVNLIPANSSSGQSTCNSNVTIPGDSSMPLRCTSWNPTLTIVHAVVYDYTIYVGNGETITGQLVAR